MLRRPATRITLSADDIAEYEKNRQRKLAEQEAQVQRAAAAASHESQGGAAKPKAHPEKTRTQTRDERMGVSTNR